MRLTTEALEAQILTTILVDGAVALAQVADLESRDFAQARHREIFQAIARLAEDDTPIGYPTVGAELIGNHAAVATLADLDRGCHVSQLPGLVRQLKAAGALLRCSALGRRISALAEEGVPTAPLSDRLTEIARIAQELVGVGARKESADDVLVSLAEVASAEIAKLERIEAGERPADPLVTSLPTLDRMLYVEPGQLLVIGGETASGKSALCGQIATVAARRKQPVVFVTSEMTHRQMLVRIVAGAAGKSVARLTNPVTALAEGATGLYRAFGNLPLLFQRSFPPRIEEATAAIRTAVARHGAKLAVIDYAQRLADTDDERQEQAIARIASESKNLALELGIVVVAAAQVNRQVSQRRDDPRPKLADLRGSGRLEQDADCVLFVYQPSRHGRPGDPEIIVAKQRNGACGVVPVKFHAESCTFREEEPAWESEDA